MSDDGKTEVEFAGVKFRGGKIFVIITALSTLGGGLYAGFEFWKDYMDMKEKIEAYTNVAASSVTIKDSPIILSKSKLTENGPWTINDTGAETNSDVEVLLRGNVFDNSETPSKPLSFSTIGHNGATFEQVLTSDQLNQIEGHQHDSGEVYMKIPHDMLSRVSNHKVGEIINLLHFYFVNAHNLVVVMNDTHIHSTTKVKDIFTVMSVSLVFLVSECLRINKF